MQSAVLDKVEVHVGVELLAFEVLVRSPAEHLFVVHQVRNPRGLGHEAKELARRDIVVDRRVKGADLADVRDGGFAAHLSELIPGVGGIKRREVRQELFRLVRLEKIVNDEVRERTGAGEFAPVPGPLLAYGGVDHEERYYSPFSTTPAARLRKRLFVFSSPSIMTSTLSRRTMA